MDKVRQVGIVAIGRNEGARLERCLRSVPPGLPVVYVDSGSSDGSVAFARSVGAQVVELDLATPFTAARARNAGLAAFLERVPALEYVQFVDGDCEFEPDWLVQAARFLDSHDAAAMVCGRRRERYPEQSIYNQMCDAEWNTPIGESHTCGGDALARVSALTQVGGFDGSIVAGEEPELCFRLRAHGWQIWRIDAPMTIHDADMHSRRQWWLRTVRCGFGYAQVWRKTGGTLSNGLYGRQVASAWFWTVGVALAALLLGLLVHPLAIFAAPTIWGAQYWRLRRRSGGVRARHLLLGKFAECIGTLHYAGAVLRRKARGTFFYK